MSKLYVLKVKKGEHCLVLNNHFSKDIEVEKLKKQDRK